MPGGVEMDVSAALARTMEDINKASDENLEGHLLVFALQIWAPERGNNVGISLFHFLGVSL